MDIDRRKAVVLLSVVAVAAIMGSIVMTAYSADNEERARAGANDGCARWFGRRMMAGTNGWQRMKREQRCHRLVEVSDEFKENVTDIAKGDEDVQDLLDDGYNITEVRPIFKAVVEGDGSVKARATDAVVLLEKDETSHATVWVDLDETKVTKIVVLTRTVIEKP